MSAVVFDLDGTLIDSAPDLHAAALQTLDEAGLPPVSLEETRTFIGNGVPKLVERLIRAAGGDLDRHAEFLDRFVAHYAANPTDRTTLYPGVREALAALAGAGHTLGLCTNKLEAPTRTILAHFDLSGCFGAVAGGDTLPQRKPDPAPLRHVVAALGGGPAVHVGDSEVDSQTAAAASVPLLLFTEGYRHSPVAEIPHRAAFAEFDRLPGLVEKVLTRAA